jgi:fructose-1-phosphate kinase PfkB-like protein
MINNKKFGAGAIRGIQTYETKGGKAVNVAYCLAKLGINNVALFTIADKIGLAGTFLLFISQAELIAIFAYVI